VRKKNRPIEALVFFGKRGKATSLGEGKGTSRGEMGGSMQVLGIGTPKGNRKGQRNAEGTLTRLGSIPLSKKPREVRKDGGGGYQKGETSP